MGAGDRNRARRRAAQRRCFASRAEAPGIPLDAAASPLLCGRFEAMHRVDPTGYPAPHDLKGKERPCPSPSSTT